MSINIALENRVRLNTCRIHKIMSTQEDSIKFLQDLKLLPTIPTTLDQCDLVDNHD